MLLRSVGEVLAAAKLTMRLGKVALVLRVTPVAVLVVRVGRKITVMAHLVVVMVRKPVAVVVVVVAELTEAVKVVALQMVARLVNQAKELRSSMVKGKGYSMIM